MFESFDDFINNSTPLNEGMFSFKTLRDNKAISAQTGADIYMFDDKGNMWHEKNYEGYGIFGGKDFFELMAEMNGEEGRDSGIDLYFSNNKKILYPALTRDEDFNSKRHKFTTKIKSDPKQGAFYESTVANKYRIKHKYNTMFESFNKFTEIINEAKSIKVSDIKMGSSFKIDTHIFKVVKIYKHRKLGDLVNTERYTDNKKAGEYTDSLKDLVDFFNEEGAVHESVVTEAKAQYMIGDKEASREDVLSYMFSNPKKPLGNASTGKFPKWVQSNNTPDGDTIKWSTIKKDMKTLEKEYGKGNVVVSGNTNGGDPVVEIYMKSQNESVVTEAKDMTFTDYLKVLDAKFEDAIAAVKGENGSDTEITPTRGDILQNFTLFRNYVSSLTKKYKGDKTKLRFLTEKVREYELVINESVVNEAKSIAKIQKEWAKVTAMMKDTVASYKEAEGKDKEDLLDQLKVLTISKKKLEVELDDAVGIKDMDVELAESRIELVSEGVNELNERTITLKRRYTENHPAITAGKTARIRNKMLEAIADGKLTEEEFNTILSEMSPDSSRWIRRNARFFNVSEDGIALSKYGMKAYRQTKINESELNEARGSWIVYTGDDEKKFYSEHTNKKSAEKMVDMIIKKFDNVNMMPKESWEKEITETFVIENFAAFEAKVTEIRRSSVSGTMSGSVYSLEDRKYELKKDVKGAMIGDFINVTLPKGTIIYNLAGGLFADHFSLKSRYTTTYGNGPKWLSQSWGQGVSIRQMPELLADIEKNSKVLESLELVNEGQFSWMTQDTGDQIGSERENTIDVYMFDNKGNKYKENKYEGYGVFGGMDYYELLARMNGYTEEDLDDKVLLKSIRATGKAEMRDIGIALAFDPKGKKIKTRAEGGKVLFPALVEDPKFNWKRHDFSQEAENDPNQSWYSEPEDEDEDDYYESVITEGAMSDIHMFAKDAKDINDFVKMFFKEFGDRVKKTADTIELAKELYTDMIDESHVNEAIKVSVDMPPSMKKWIMGEVKSNPDTWSNELTDITNAIVSAHREYDLDLLKSEKGPEWVDIRDLPTSELTSRCIETINDLWSKMGDQSKESIYDDYSNWFKVTKKYRPLYGMYESVVNKSIKN